MTPNAARLLLLLAAALWGMTFVANHELLLHLAPEQIVVTRFTIVASMFLAILAARPELRPRFTRREWAVMLVCGLLAVPGAQLSLTHGQQYLSPAMSGLVVATGPAFAAVLAVAFLRERLTPRQLVGIVLAFCGAAVVILFTSGTGTDLTVRNPWGAALVATAQLSWAAYTVISKRIAQNHAPVTAVAMAVVLGTLLMTPAVPSALRTLPSLPVSGWLWFLHLAVLGTVVPYLIWFTSLRYLDANETVVFMFLIPLFAVTWSALILGERPAPLGLLGGVGILIGVSLTQRVSFRRRRPLTSPPEVPT